jgi:hypothetical protein
MSKQKKSVKVKKKKSAYKRKVKGVRYIASVLAKYFKKAYKNKRIALPRAREILLLLSESKTKVTVASIMSFERKSKIVVTSKKVELDGELLIPQPYFNLQDYPAYILRSEKGVVFKSKLIPSGLPEIQSGELISYEEYFRPFVNYINKMASLTDKDDNRYETDWLVVCTEPALDSKGRLVSEIISLDNIGDEVDYGFNPGVPTGAPDKVIVKGSLPTGKIDKGVVSPEGVDVTKEIELEKVKQKTINEQIELEKEKQKTIDEKMKAFRELKDAGMSIEQINKFLGL